MSNNTERKSTNVPEKNFNIGNDNERLFDEELFNKAWGYLTEGGRRRFLDLPPCSKDIFYKITGIEIDK